MLQQQTRLESDAQRVYDGSSARVFEATRTIRGLERLAREGDVLIWVAEPSLRAMKRQQLRGLQDDAALQGDPDIRAIVSQAFSTLDENLADLAKNGTAAQERSATRWAPVMQRILNKSEAVGAEVSDVATREADQILQSTEDARKMLIGVAGLVGAISLLLFGFVYFLLTRPVVRLAKALVKARDGSAMTGRQELIRELQMLDDAAVALGSAHQELQSTRAQLEQMAHTDTLTGLANRRMFERQGQRAFSHARRYDEILAGVVFDIDHFKRINDQFGHEGGDVVLRNLGDFLRDAVRAAEYPIARIGGEEFALLLTHTPQQNAVLLAERLRKGIEAIEVAMPNGASIHFTVSMGVAQCNASDDNLSTLLRRADAALYRAKHNGRNRVEQENSPTKPLPFL
jgi:diguanylate cyclase (GGDEF)-like protein